MIDYISDFLWPIGLFAGAILCSLCQNWLPRWKCPLTFLTALFSVIAMLTGLIQGMTLEELVIPFLLLLWISLSFIGSKEGKNR